MIGDREPIVKLRRQNAVGSSVALRHLLACVVGIVVLLAVAPACGGGPSESLVFGEHDDACEPTVLRNEVDDDARLADGGDCFVAEVAAGRPVVWDLLRLTVEGDPIPVRYDYDGTEVVITEDFRRDAFGDAGVRVRRCTSAVGGDPLPEGVDCERTDGDGFVSDGLP